MDPPPRSSRTVFVMLIMMMAVLLVIPMAGAQTSGGPVSVPKCKEEGQRCYGGEDCENSICVNHCGGGVPICQCDCDVTQPDPGGDITWIVVIGVVCVLGVGGGLVIKGRQKKSLETPKEKEKEKKKPSVYILQLSTDRMTVGPDNPGQLTVTVWKQEPNGSLRQAPEASIRIPVPAAYSGLKVVPSAGQGTLTTQVRIEGAIKAGEVPLTVTAGAAGSSESAQVTVVIEQDYVMEFF